MNSSSSQAIRPKDKSGIMNNNLDRFMAIKLRLFDGCATIIIPE